MDYGQQQREELSETDPGWVRGRAEFTANWTTPSPMPGWWSKSIPEQLEPERSIFAQLEAAAPSDPILASNSPSYPSKLIVYGLLTTDRMLNTHFYMPPAQIAVDVMSCGNTSQEVLDFVLATFPKYGMLPFLVRRESTGVHLQPPLGRDQT